MGDFMRANSVRCFAAASVIASALALVLLAQPVGAAPLTVPVSDCRGTKATVTGFVGKFPEGATGPAAPGDMRQFLGIRYAKAPNGARRWQPPELYCWR